MPLIAYLLALNQEAFTVHFIVEPLRLTTIAPFCGRDKVVHGNRPSVEKHWRYIFGTIIAIYIVTAPNVYVFNL